jgi:predicted RNA-binding protein YlxR (DUF448 family)
MKQDRKDAMVRIAMDAGTVRPDFDGTGIGRGGYLHQGDECLERFVKSRVREFKSLRIKIDRDHRIAIVEAIRERLDRKPALE